MRSIFLLFFILISSFVYSQNDTINNINDFSVDALGNCYAIRSNEIIKINKDGKIVSNNSRRDNGIPSIIDAIDPLRILVLFKDFGMLSLYDNFLGSQPDIDLRMLGINDPQLIAATNDGGAWVYDRSTNQIFKIDPNLKKNLLTIDLRQLLFKVISPDAMRISANWMLLLSGTEIFVFDQYGTFVKTIKIDAKPTIFQLKDDELIVGNKEKLTKQHLKFINSETTISENIPANALKSYISDKVNWHLLINKQLIHENKE